MQVTVLIRGAGDIASGIALRLYRSGMRVIMTEIEKPTTIRRSVAFSEAVLNKRQTVEGVTAERADSPEEAESLMERGIIPVLVDPQCLCRVSLLPDVLVDAILAKRNLGTSLTDAPVVIGVGPGFTAGKDCHAVVETMRGHTLGRAYYEGSALPNTNIPGLIGGYAGERVIRAPRDGIFHSTHEIGDPVGESETVGFVEGEPVKTTISGVLRGLLADGISVTKGMKSGDVDPRGKREYCDLVSDKALSVAGGVLEAILHYCADLQSKSSA
ncbi:MAG: EF2563 family selenium-dependent molybdenum hydroxylase system protein [Lachnospiraceae bacterium]|nr:EF2563 family selenium-dependent molybdenum hydroxylase system protein [Lachnospiraceae bacterium]